MNWADLGLPANCAVRDLWAKKDLGTVPDGQTFKVAPHASAFFRLTPAASRSEIEVRGDEHN